MTFLFRSLDNGHSRLAYPLEIHHNKITLVLMSHRFNIPSTGRTLDLAAPPAPLGMGGSSAASERQQRHRQAGQ